MTINELESMDRDEVLAAVTQVAGVPAIHTEYTRHETVTDAQSAVACLQHIVTRFQQEPDVVYVAALAIYDVAVEAAENGNIVDPLKGADDFLPAHEVCLCGAPMVDGWCSVEGCACSMTHTAV